jgi:hypothetical protein|tara:strand:- start:4411 stop:5325 length:915 start_codon:yes stop_codon:yes gene_type:complete
MSNYFKNFPKIDYSFGNNEAPVQFQDIGVYVDIIDQVKEYSTFYQAYNIENGQRPDQVSLDLYQSSNYYWTFYLLNDSLRTGGWPLQDHEIYVKGREYYPHMAFTTNAVVSLQEPSFNKYPTVPGANEILWIPNGTQLPLCADKNFVVGSWVYFKGTKSVGKILKIDQDLGLVTTDAVGVNSIEDEIVYSIDGESALRIQGGDKDFEPTYQRAQMYVYKVYEQWESTHHYEDAATGDWIYPSIGALRPWPLDQSSVSSSQAITYLERIRETNLQQKVISVIKPESINDIVLEFNRLLKGNIDVG